MSRPITVLYSSENDPVAKLAGRWDGKLRHIHVDQLLPRLAAQPWPDVLHIEADEEIRSSFSDAYVINRVFNLNNTRTCEFLNQNGVDERWFHIRLQDLLTLAESTSNDTGVRGVSRSLLPLNAQWYEIKRFLPNLAIPEFAYARGYEPADLSAIEDPIQKSVWSLFDWKVERHLPPEEARRHQFFVERPKGIPLITYYFGEEGGVFFPRDIVDVDSSQLKSINNAARVIFESEFGEVLLYSEDGILRFYAFSPYLLSVPADNDFSDYFRQWISKTEVATPLFL